MPAGRTRAIRTFAFEMSARWYAVGLAQKVREAGITAKAAPRHHQMLAAATHTMTSSARVSPKLP
jgi:hypothetical protein